jgi:hypothetical protein
MTASAIDSTGGADITFRRYDAASARQIRAVVEAVYVGSYVDAIASGDPFDSVEAFMHRFDAYTSRSSFDSVVAYQGDEAVGQTWGWPLDERATTTGWWVGLLEEPEVGFTWEDGRRLSLFQKLWFFEIGPGRALRMRCMTSSCSVGRSSAPPCLSSRTTLVPVGRTSIGDGARWRSCGPDGITHPCLTYWFCHFRSVPSHVERSG